MDLSKAFNTINHDLLIVKLRAYGFDKRSLKVIFSSLNKRWHRTTINQNFSLWEELLQGVPQGSVLGPLHFNIQMICSVLLSLLRFATFQMTPYFFASDKYLNSLIKRLKHDSLLGIEWFENNNDTCWCLDISTEMFRLKLEIK